MSVSKLGIILFSSFLIFVTAPSGSAQSTQGQNREAGKNAHQQPSSEPAATSVDDVKRIQQQLADLGYNPGEPNGVMTSDTQEAIRQFQWINSMPVTGIVDQQTMQILNTQASSGNENTRLGQAPLSAEREKPAYNQEQTGNTKNHKEGTHEKGAAGRIDKASAVLEELTNAKDNGIPKEILERAEAVVVIPHVVKGAFGIGGRYGKGVAAERMADGRWSAPAFMDIGGGSFGLQLGASATDLVLVFTSRKGLDMLEGGKDLKLGVDAGIVAGPVGRSAEAGANAKLESAIYAYSRSKGLFAGVALDGAVLYTDNDMNRRVYGDSVDSKQILIGRVQPTAIDRPFRNALERAVPKKRIS